MTCSSMILYCGGVELNHSIFEVCLQCLFLALVLDYVHYIKCVRNCSFLLNFLEEFEKDQCLFSQCLVEFTNDTFQSWVFLVGRFLIADSISLLVIDLFRSSISLSQFWQIFLLCFQVLVHVMQVIQFVDVQQFIILF